MVNEFMQSILDRLARLEAEIANIDKAVNSMTADITKTATTSEVALSISTLNEYIHTLNSAMRLAKRAGLPEEFSHVVTEVQRILRLINTLKIAYYALTAAELAAGNPLAIIQTGIAIGSVVVTAADTEW